MMSDGKYTFKVPLKLIKSEIRKAVEKIFDVKVESVSTLRTMGKYKRMGKKFIGKRPDFKKAIVTALKEGETIQRILRSIRFKFRNKLRLYNGH